MNKTREIPKLYDKNKKKFYGKQADDGSIFLYRCAVIVDNINNIIKAYKIRFHPDVLTYVAMCALYIIIIILEEFTA